MAKHVETEPPERLQFKDLLRGHENRWVALDEEMKNVVASGETFAVAAAKAEAEGFEAPIVIWSPPTLRGFEL